MCVCVCVCVCVCACVCVQPYREHMYVSMCVSLCGLIDQQIGIMDIDISAVHQAHGTQSRTGQTVTLRHGPQRLGSWQRAVVQTSRYSCVTVLMCHCGKFIFASRREVSMCRCSNVSL